MKLFPVTALALLAAGLVGCAGSAGTAVSTFDYQGGGRPACLLHQQRQPTALYRPGRAQNTAAVLDLLKYYTQNGGRPYCDGRPATAVDRAWATLYVDLGATPAHVASILGH